MYGDLIRLLTKDFCPSSPCVLVVICGGFGGMWGVVSSYKYEGVYMLNLSLCICV